MTKPTKDNLLAGMPLPHGTEVTTAVDRVVGDLRVPQGALGRVVAHQDRWVDVQIVGTGVVRYGRDEVHPHRAGQMRWAARRQDAWAALRPTVVLETVVGSRAWGLSEAHSDTDTRGVFVWPFRWAAGLADPPADLVSADSSNVYWEVDKAIRQALRCDPNTLEMLFVEGATPRDELGAWLLAEREAFVSLRVYGSFGRYALSQLKKLRQSLRLAEHRVLLLRWLREDRELTLDAVAARLSAEVGIVAPTEQDRVLRAKEYIKQVYGSLADQKLIAGKSLEHLRDFAVSGEHDFELPRKLRPKNAYNLLRLLVTATGWLKQGTPTFEVRGELREELMRIKRGEVDLEEVLRRAEELSRELEDARQCSKLPEHPDLPRAHRLLIRIREQAGRRWFEGRPGPFGQDAPPAPEPERQS